MDNAGMASSLENLLEHLSRIFVEHGYDAASIDEDNARNALEMTQGNVALAAQLYWEDFLATRGEAAGGGAGADAWNEERPEDPHEEEEEEEEEPEDEPEGEELEMEPPDAPGDAPDRMVVGQPPEDVHYNGAGRAVRRRLEPVFDREAGVEEDPEVEMEGGVARIVERARIAVMQLDEGNNDDEPREDNVVDIAAQAARVLAARDPESVSVSDDESGTAAARRWALLGEREEGRSREGKRKRAALSRESDEARQDEQSDEINDMNGYLSDNDWLWESLVSRERIPDDPPIGLLWSLQTSESNADAGSQAGAEEPDTESNVIEHDEGDEEANTEMSIPRTWLRAGFYLSECTEGLVLRHPVDEDIAYQTWEEETAGRGNNKVPPPYHCRAISALISIVNALLYTGAAYQLNDITCSMTRKPFAELTYAERKREFESRLADALAALLYVAAKASVNRKTKALDSLRQSKDPADKRKWQKLERKLRLCPTCSWQVDPDSGDSKLPLGRETGKSLQVATSYSNIDALRSYVLSNMRSFTSSGGCALLLETIIRIHGKGAVSRMIRRSRREAKLTPPQVGLVSCSCEERHKQILNSNPAMARRRNKPPRLMDMTPKIPDCISTELLSLLLTGRVHSTLQGWSSGNLGVGILSDTPGEVGRGLSRPSKPVWILRGPTCYSVLCLVGSNDHSNTFSRKDIPGSVAKLTHWNCWYGQRFKTDLRLVVNQAKWVAPKPSGIKALLEKAPVTALERMQRRRQEAEIVSADEEGVETVDEELVISAEEMDRIKVNPEDMKFYPNKYRMWRYDLGETTTSSEDSKIRAEQWIPYHRLDSRAKMAVESKLGPKISTILWTRWPRATIDRFLPLDPPPVV